MKPWTLTKKKRLVVLLIASVLAGLFGYVETFIPAIFPQLPYLRVQLSMLFALFILFCYSPADASIVWGIRCLIFGLVLDDGYAILFELFAGVLAFVSVWALLKTRKFGTISMGVACGLVYALIYSFLACIVPKNVAPLCLLAQTLTFYTVNHALLGAVAYIAFKFIPEKLLID